MSISSTTTSSVSQSVYNDIHTFLFKVYTDPCDESKPYPIKEISKIKILDKRTYAVYYVSTNNKNESLLVYSGELENMKLKN